MADPTNTVASQFLVEVAPAGPDGPGGAAGGSPVASLEEMNALFDAWLGQVYHRSANETTGLSPAEAWKAGWAGAEPRRATLGQIAEAFLWSAARKVRSDGTVLLEGNRYEVDPALAGRKVEVVYDPYEMGGPVRILLDGEPAGEGRPAEIGRHVHKKAQAAARDENQGAAGGAATGIDYLRLLEADRRAEIARAGIDYRTLSDGRAAGQDWEQGVLV